MTDEQVSDVLVTPGPEVVEQLFAARDAGTVGVDLSSLHLGREEALDYQLAALDLARRRGDQVSGWKVAYTSGPARDKLGLGYRAFGYLLESRTLASGAEVDRSRFPNFDDMRVEAELCLVLRSDLEGAVDRETARAAVGSVVASFELVEHRTAAGADDATALADGCSNWGIVTGSGVTGAPEGLDRAIASLWHDNRLLATVEPDYPMDDPYASLAALAAKLHEHGGRLEEGQRVITGAFLNVAVDGPGQWSAAFDGIGEVSFTVTDGVGRH